jgi:hypothetical protein
MHKRVLVTAMALSMLIVGGSNVQARSYDRGLSPHAPNVSRGIITFVIGFIIGYTAGSIATKDKVSNTPEVTQDR